MNLISLVSLMFFMRTTSGHICTILLWMTFAITKIFFIHFANTLVRYSAPVKRQANSFL